MCLSELGVFCSAVHHTQLIYGACGTVCSSKGVSPSGLMDVVLLQSDLIESLISLHPKQYLIIKNGSCHLRVRLLSDVGMARWDSSSVVAYSAGCFISDRVCALIPV